MNLFMASSLKSAHRTVNAREQNPTAEDAKERRERKGEDDINRRWTQIRKKRFSICVYLR